MGYSPWGHRESDTTERLNNVITVYVYNLQSTCNSVDYPPNPLFHKAVI